MRLNLISKLYFYLTLIIFKIASPFECRSYRLKIFVNEFVFIFYALCRFENISFKNCGEILLKTTLGNFYIRDLFFDLEVASPSFERLDLNKLISMIRTSLDAGKVVTFIDVGAGFGKYSIAVGKLLSDYRSHLNIISFEPDPTAYELLQKNILVNRLENITAHNVALSNKTELKKFFYYKQFQMIVSFKTSQHIYIQSTKLDSLMSKYKIAKGSELFMKIDVEGHEVEVLKGASKTIRKHGCAIVLIEDVFKRNKLNQYLLNRGFFLSKRTELNSFWKLTQ